MIHSRPTLTKAIRIGLLAAFAGIGQSALAADREASSEPATTSRTATPVAVEVVPADLVVVGLGTPVDGMLQLSIQNRGARDAGKSHVAVFLRSDGDEGLRSLLVGAAPVPPLAPGAVHTAIAPVAVSRLLEASTYRVEAVADALGAVDEGPGEANNTVLFGMAWRDDLGGLPLDAAFPGEARWLYASVYGEFAAGRMEGATFWGLDLRTLANLLAVPADADLTGFNAPSLLAGMHLAVESGLGGEVGTPFFWDRVARQGPGLEGFDGALAEYLLAETGVRGTLGEESAFDLLQEGVLASAEAYGAERLREGSAGSLSPDSGGVDPAFALDPTLADGGATSDGCDGDNASCPADGCDDSTSTCPEENPPPPPPTEGECDENMSCEEGKEVEKLTIRIFTERLMYNLGLTPNYTEDDDVITAGTGTRADVAEPDCAFECASPVDLEPVADTDRSEWITDPADPDADRSTSPEELDRIVGAVSGMLEQGQDPLIHTAEPASEEPAPVEVPVDEGPTTGCQPAPYESPDTGCDVPI